MQTSNFSSYANFVQLVTFQHPQLIGAAHAWKNHYVNTASHGCGAGEQPAAASLGRGSAQHLRETLFPRRRQLAPIFGSQFGKAKVQCPPDAWPVKSSARVR